MLFVVAKNKFERVRPMQMMVRSKPENDFEKVQTIEARI